MRAEYRILGSLAICLILEGGVLLVLPTHQLGGGMALLAGLVLFVGTGIAVLKDR